MPNIEKVKKFKERVARFVINAGSNVVLWLRRKLASPVEPKPAIGRFLAASGILNFGASILVNMDPAYKSLMHQFHSKWLKKSNDLRVERVFKVKVPMSVYKKHVQYEKGHHSNTRRRSMAHHAPATATTSLTWREPRAEVKTATSVASACGASSSRKTWGARRRQQSSTCGTEKACISAACPARPTITPKIRKRDGRKWRCMFAATVAVGLAYLTKEGFLPDKMCPPGFDAVVGEVGPNLNYDEVVVYDKAAAIYQLSLSSTAQPDSEQHSLSLRMSAYVRNILLKVEPLRLTRLPNLQSPNGDNGVR